MKTLLALICLVATAAVAQIPTNLQVMYIGMMNQPVIQVRPSVSADGKQSFTAVFILPKHKDLPPMENAATWEQVAREGLPEVLAARRLCPNGWEVTSVPVNTFDRFGRSVALAGNCLP